ncbi:MAG: hypothetical protein A2X08_10340 [Bacteroidetes bacterium GWA2_32_17]|nr:MAG: hypothetical protein A2X08_10340 [Bacteroidetes bacterium GWA2_32_17]
MKKVLLLFVFVLLIDGCKTLITSSNNRNTNWANKIELNGLYNLFKVDDNLFRSEQPNRKDMITLKNYGIKTILNLRHTKTDNCEAKNTNLEIQHITINTWTISYEDIVQSLKTINNSKKPVLIHCLHGSDRTGCIVAAYRMTNCNWTKDEAIKEFKEGGFGYHEKWFPNILELLNNINIEQLKKDVSNKKLIFQ